MQGKNNMEEEKKLNCEGDSGRKVKQTNKQSYRKYSYGTNKTLQQKVAGTMPVYNSAFRQVSLRVVNRQRHNHHIWYTVMMIGNSL
jgi:hypothetical protein